MYESFGIKSSKKLQNSEPNTSNAVRGNKRLKRWKIRLFR